MEKPENFLFNQRKTYVEYSDDFDSIFPCDKYFRLIFSERIIWKQVNEKISDNSVALHSCYFNIDQNVLFGTVPKVLILVNV